MNQKAQENRSILGTLFGIFGIYLFWTAFNVFQAQAVKNIFDANLYVPSLLGILSFLLAYHFLNLR